MKKKTRKKSKPSKKRLAQLKAVRKRHLMAIKKVDKQLAPFGRVKSGKFKGKAILDPILFD
jgi:hypothetical protein